jgi:hypothetical protein
MTRRSFSPGAVDGVVLPSVGRSIGARMGRSALSLMASLSCVCVLGAAHASLASGRDWLSRRHSAPGSEWFLTTVETAVLRCQRSGVSMEVSPNSPRSAKSTASETPGGGGSVAGGTSSGA